MTGERGDSGDRGVAGERGPKGDHGQHGEQGDRGPKGEKGDTGPKRTKRDALHYIGWGILVAQMALLFTTLALVLDTRDFAKGNCESLNELRKVERESVEDEVARLRDLKRSDFPDISDARWKRIILDATNVEAKHLEQLAGRDCSEL